MLPTPLNVSRETARRFHRRAVLLDAPVPDIGTAVAHLGFVQIDPINICARATDLRLRAVCNQVIDT